ncbi:hypothetical protein [Oceanicella sp. SM1341]|uniref:hypothetical protein n=1 Tax=Oceanicella sp. SM1341 TaxID=1548889 RepID=UPI000E4C7250|nr:hypothetical protein [Oceanicella sp. SM1341]
MRRSLYIVSVCLAAVFAGGIAGALRNGVAEASPDRVAPLGCARGVITPPEGYAELLRPMPWTCETRAARQQEMTRWLEEADAFFLRRAALQRIEAARSARAVPVRPSACGGELPVCMLTR